MIIDLLKNTTVAEQKIALILALSFLGILCLVFAIRGK